MDLINNYKFLLDSSRKAKRFEYFLVSWCGLFFIAFVIFILDIQGFSEESLGVIALILLLLLIPINITTAIARCHDLGWSGWWYLLVFVPVANIILPIALLALPSKK